MIRAHGNFIETSPLTIILVLVLELMGASQTGIHLLLAFFLIGRISHAIGMIIDGSKYFTLFRSFGMVTFILVSLVASVWTLILSINSHA